MQHFFYNNQMQNLLTLSPIKRTWMTICSDLFHFQNLVSDEQLSSEQCRVYYVRYQMENLAWTASLALMSWVLRNFQRKMENGHCNNTVTHDHGEREPRNCDQGRSFHRDRFNRCLQSYKNVINMFEPAPQTQAGGQNTTNPAPQGTQNTIIPHHKTY